MKITLAVIGKTEVGFVRQGIEEYVKRLQHYVQFNIQYVGDVKGTRNMSEAQQKAAEGKALLSTLETSDHVCSTNMVPSARRWTSANGCSAAWPVESSGWCLSWVGLTGSLQRSMTVPTRKSR